MVVEGEVWGKEGAAALLRGEELGTGQPLYQLNSFMRYEGRAWAVGCKGLLLISSGGSGKPSLQFMSDSVAQISPESWSVPCRLASSTLEPQGQASGGQTTGPRGQTCSSWGLGQDTPTSSPAMKNADVWHKPSVGSKQGG